MDQTQEIEHLREALAVCTEQNKELREILEASVQILTSKKVIVVKKDDEFRDIIETYLLRLVDFGIVEKD